MILLKMVKWFLFILMEINMMVNGWMIKDMDKGLYIYQIKIYIKVTGKMINLMVIKYL